MNGFYRRQNWEIIEIWSNRKTTCNETAHINLEGCREILTNQG